MSEGATHTEKRQVIGAAGGALGLGALAAAVGSCCGAPWAVALLGVSGAVALARLAFLLPYALIGAGALLAIAFWSVYRPARPRPDGTCTTTGRESLRIIVWIATVLVAVLATYAFVSVES